LVMPPFRYLHVLYVKKWIERKIDLGQFKVYSQGPVDGFEFSSQTNVQRDVSPTAIDSQTNIIDIEPSNTSNSKKDE